MKRPILVALIGYIIGIIWGLYFKISIVFLYPFIIIVVLACKKIIEKSTMVRGKTRILKVVISSQTFKKILFLVLITAVVSDCIVKFLNNDYDMKYKNIQKATFIATVLEEKKEKQYYLQYKIKVERINNKKVKRHYLLLKLKNKKLNLKIGDKIQFEGEYQEPQGQRNTKGFDYKLYLKSQKVYGLVITNSAKVLKHDNQSLFRIISSKLLEYTQNSIQNLIKDKDEQDLLQGLIIGKDDNMDEDLKESFNNSSLSHILAISGMHVTYIITGIMAIFSIAKFSKKSSKILLIFLLFLFCGMTNFTTTVVRAVFMTIISIVATLVYRKNDVLTSMSITLWLILLDNPFALFSASLVLSFLGTIGVVVVYNIFFSSKNMELYLADNLTWLEKIYIKITEISMVSISAQICIFPIIIYSFNKLSLTFIISNILVSFLIGPILVLGFLLILFNILFSPIAKIFIFPLSFFLQILIKTAKVIECLPMSNIILATPNLILVIAYYILLFIFVTKLKKKIQKTATYKGSKDYKCKFIANKIIHKLSTIVDNLCGYIVKRVKIVVISISIMCITFFAYGKVNSNLNIYFIDIGQGDSTLIVTPSNKRILVDGGGSSSDEFDVGKSTLVPYLLDRGIKRLDYIIVSHFDTDHVRTDC